MKYTIDGHEVVVKQELKDGKFLVAFLYEEQYGENCDVIESEHLSVVNRVFDKPPQKKRPHSRSGEQGLGGFPNLKTDS